MNKQAFLASMLAGVAACAPDVRITQTVRLNVEFEDTAFDTSLIKTVEIVLDAKAGKMPPGLNRAVRRADTVEGLIVYSESRDVDGDRTDSELVLSTEGNPFGGGRRAWGLDITGKDDTEFSVEARILNRANEIIARATTSFDVTGHPIVFGNDYKQVVLRVRCEENANCTGVAVVPNRPADAGAGTAAVADAGAVAETDAGTTAVADAGAVAKADAGAATADDAGAVAETDAGAVTETDAGTPVDAGPPVDTTAPVISNISVSPTVAAPGQAVLVEFDVNETLSGNPQVTLDTWTMTRLSGSAYRYQMTIPSSATGGAKTITIRAIDLANNVGTATVTMTIDATSGTPDPAFGVNGVRTHSNTAGGNDDEFARAGAFDPNGRLVVVGKSRADAGSTVDRLALWRITDGGALDPGLQNKGYITHPGLTEGLTSANAVAIAPTGEIYVAGTTTDPNGGSHVAIWGFFSNGYPITSFGQAGVTTFTGSQGTGVANSIALKPGATAASLGIYAAGYSVSTAGIYEVTVWKVTTTGAADSTFNGSGAVTIVSPNRGANRATGIAVADAGQLYMVGTSVAAGGGYDLGLWSLLADGATNPGFGTSGVVTLRRNSAIANDSGNAITLVGNNLYAAGLSANTANKPEAILWNLTTTGAVVPTFATNGVWTGSFAAPASGTTATSVAVDGKGRIVLGGGTVVPRTDEGVRIEGTLWRLNANGSADTIFNRTGTMTLPGATGTANANDTVYDVVIDSANRITAVGGGYNAAGNLDMAIWRVR